MESNQNNNRLDSLLIDLNASLLSALKQMDQINRKLLIVSEDGQFYGVLSIGDLQRAIINKFPLDKPIKHILRNKFVVSSDDESLEVIKAKMLSERIEFMPVIDKNRCVIDVIFWEDVFGFNIRKNKINLNLPVVIMAGGSGTRLKPLTNVLPKPLIPINEKTIIENIMDNFIDIGCNKFYISVNYKAEIIKYYLGNMLNKEYDISFFQENKPLGTAGSMYLIKTLINSTFFVTNCDIIIDQDLSDVYQYHITNKNDITIISALNHYNIPYGTIETKTDGILNLLDEKPELVFQINTGVYILEPSTLTLIPENSFFHFTELIKLAGDNGAKIGVFPIAEKSYKDIGTWHEYLKLVNYL